MTQMTGGSGLTRTAGSGSLAGMVRLRIVLFLGWLVAWLPGPVCAQGEGDVAERLIRRLSPELRRIEQRLGEIGREMESLPEVREEPWGSRFGHRSGDLPSGTSPDWVQLDLGDRRKVDMVALMPVNLAYLGEARAGYGFPKRFRVEISNHPDMRDAVVVVDRSASDVPNPGQYPLVFEFGPVAGRHLRFTSLKHDSSKGKYFWALEELIVMSGNLMAGAGSNVTESSRMVLVPQWAPARIVDAQSTLGMPVDVTTPSPTIGYLSASLKDMASGGRLLPPGLWKWCAVDLQKPEVIEQVNLLPLESDAYEVVGGRGFPRIARVQLADESDFGEVVWENRMSEFVLGYPPGCPFSVAVPKVKARYVRVLVGRMWGRDDAGVFGLAELQVCGSNRNLALNKPVFVKDETDKPPEAGWAPAALVDGYSSRHRLIEWPEYLRLMDRRGRLEKEKTALEHRREAKLKLGKEILAGIAVSAGVLVVAAWIWGMVRHRVLRRREVERLRQQIARDLHDDIGSNLGGIVLLSEIGSEHSPDEESRSDFLAIRKAAEDASLSMRDIVWLIQRERVGLKDFVTRMRQSVRVILNHPEVSLEVEPAEFRDRPLGLLFRRHVFLAFKEALNNVRKHAQTREAAVKLEILPDRLRFTVRDHGVGFDPGKVGGSGHGLNNLKRRASRVAGDLRIDSAPGKGTEVVFEAPFSK
ncbi:ATP-binding protein [Haloferula sp. A504]|uniref:ATP-binding protein n=1 Tax=Haloferula sp. A504 TaxID=3373601 RepID=UPI0031BE2E0A|nr:ATP-binding protein [Verrucomicrobiaceae bacterium E54]